MRIRGARELDHQWTPRGEPPSLDMARTTEWTGGELGLRWPGRSPSPTEARHYRDVPVAESDTVGTRSSCPGWIVLPRRPLKSRRVESSTPCRWTMLHKVSAF